MFIGKMACYNRLTPLEKVDLAPVLDKYTDTMKYKKMKLHRAGNPPLCPVWLKPVQSIGVY